MSQQDLRKQFWTKVLRGYRSGRTNPKSVVPSSLKIEHLEDRSVPAALTYSNAVHFGNLSTIAVMSGDLTGDGRDDTVIATGATFQVADGASGASLASFAAFDPSANGTLWFAVANTTGDSRADIKILADLNGVRVEKIIDGSMPRNIKKSVSGSFGNSGSVVEGGSASVAFTQVSDPLGRGVTYSYDFDNDGTYEISGSSNASASVPANLLADGPKTATVRGRVIDADGRSANYTTAISVANAAPTPFASGPDAVKLGQVASFAATATDPSSADTAAGFAFSWNFGDGGTAQGASQTHTYATPGTYTVTLTSTDNDGASKSVTRTVVADAEVPPTAPPTSPPTVPPTTPPTTPPTVPPTTPPTSPPTVPPTTPPPAAPPAGSFGNSGSVVEGGSASVAFTQVSDPLGRGVTYSYDFDNDGTYEISGSSNASASVPANLLADGPKTATVRGRVTDAGGRTATYTTAFQVTNVAPTPVLGAPDAVKLGDPAAFAGSATDPSPTDTSAGFSFAWTFGDGSSATGKNATHTYATPGTYTVTLTATDKDGTAKSVTRTTTVVDMSNSASGVIVTPDFIITPHDKIPNFGKNPALVAVQSGNWSDPATWGGRLPAADDVISINNGITISYDQVSDVEVKTVAIQFGATLNFRTDASTRLRVTNLLVMEGGTLTVGTTANPVSAAVKAEIIINDVAIDTSKDPSQYGNGMLVFGKVSMHGAALSKTFVTAAGELRAGDTSVTLSEPVPGWRVGDRILLPDTRQLTWGNRPNNPGVTFVSQVERATIAAISADGRTVSLTAPIAFDHVGAKDGDGVTTFAPSIGNLSRNVVVRSESASGVRGHTMYLARADVDIRFAQFSGLGRTTNDPFDNSRFDANGAVTALGTNQQGRYSIHFQHLYGPVAASANGHQYTFEGNSVFCPIDPMPFRWGIAINDSHYGLVKDNVLFNWAGAGIIAESGNESFNVLEHNYVSRVPYSGTGETSRGYADVGHTSSGIWMAGMNNYVRNNYVNSAQKGYNINNEMGQNYHRTPIPLFPGADTTKADQIRLVHMMKMPLLEFSGNEAGGALETGLSMWNVGSGHNVSFLGVDESVVKDFHVWHVWDFAYYNYKTTAFTFDGLIARNDFSILRNGQGGGVALFASDYIANDYTIRNSDIQGFTTGWHLALGNRQTIENTFMRNYLNISVVPSWMAQLNPDELPDRTVRIDGVRFASAGMNRRSDWGPQGNIFMDGRMYSSNTSLILKDEVFVTNYNGVAGDDFQLYYPEQAADRILPKSVMRWDGLMLTLLGSSEEGLTNQENWDKYGIAFAGKIAPATTTTRAGIIGLVEEL